MDERLTDGQKQSPPKIIDTENAVQGTNNPEDYLLKDATQYEELPESWWEKAQNLLRKLRNPNAFTISKRRVVFPNIVRGADTSTNGSSTEKTDTFPLDTRKR